jgi:hypothetical protein
MQQSTAGTVILRLLSILPSFCTARTTIPLDDFNQVFGLENKHQQMIQATYYRTETSTMILSDLLSHLMMPWSS